MTSDEQEYSRFVFGTKAETLERLRRRVAEAVVPEFIHFTRERWSQSRGECLRQIKATLGSSAVIVRSSALAEDGDLASAAGAYLSCLGIDSGDHQALADSIDAVMASMPNLPGDQVLVQRLLSDVAVSGVIMTFDVDHGAPYYRISFDDESGATDHITGGRGIHKSVQIYRKAPPGHLRSQRVRRFVKLARELEAITEVAALDIEFALDRSGVLHLLQVRRITRAESWHPVTERRVERQLVHIEAFVQQRSSPRPGIVGRRTILGVMPDWNPAEIIGTRPRPLAASLYDLLVTRQAWREARVRMGYRPLPGEALMVLLNGQPYIDVRNSFNSFLPATLDDKLGERLVDAWLDRLEASPELHDKVEFDVVPTCLDFMFREHFRLRYPAVLTPAEQSEYEEALRSLTESALAPGPAGSLAGAANSAEALDARQRNEPAPHPDSDPYTLLATAAQRLERCRNTGVIAFAILARHAFIAEALLRSACQRGALSPARLKEFRRSLHTVTSGLLAEYSAVVSGRCAAADFLDRYGHLRPGTYDITSLRYDERRNLFAACDAKLSAADAAEPFRLAADERKALNGLLTEYGLSVIDADGLMDHAARAIRGREYAKFVFTRDLSDALDLLVGWGRHNGLSRDDISYLQWSDMEATLTRPVIDDADRHFLSLVELGKRAAESSQTSRLAHLICGVRDIYVATENRSVPNFIAGGRVAGPITVLGGDASADRSLAGRIVCIENADPGFDWIFTRQPLALVTCFGGANSHMAIRCSEIGLPAAIGCGEQLYRRLVSAGAAELDCDHRILHPHVG